MIIKRINNVKSKVMNEIIKSNDVGMLYNIMKIIEIDMIEEIIERSIEDHVKDNLERYFKH